MTMFLIYVPSHTVPEFENLNQNIEDDGMKNTM